MATTVKWGIIGLGMIAHKFAEGLRHIKSATLFAIASRDIKKAEQFSAKYKVPNYYGSYEEIAQDNSVDIIYIATPHSLHYENTIMCLNNKKAVLCEKPFAINSIEVKKMIECAKQNNVFLMEAMWTKFLPHIRKIVDIVNDNKLGKLKTLFADFGFKAEFNPDHRLFNINLGGGSLLDIGIYPVFIALLLFGKPDKIIANANIGETKVDESCGIVFTYNDGKMAILHSTFLADTPIEAQLFGTKANVKICSRWFAPTNLIIKSRFKRSKPIKVKHLGNGYNYEAEHATQCILDGKKESDIMPFQFSCDLIELLDQIRKECGIEYPNHD